MAASEPSAFGVLLRRHRIDAGLTQEEIAEQAELSARLVSDLERGVTQAPQRHTIQKLADALRLSEEDRARFRESARRRRSRKEASAEQVPHGIDLLRDPTPFLGRESETAALVQLLQRPNFRLLTLTGPGGSGKTRLALEVASARLDRFEHGVFFVSLAPITDPNLVASAIAATLGLKDVGDQAQAESLKQFMTGKRLLLVLDNFEHVLAAAPLVGDLVQSCTSIQIMVTSREILHLAAEREFPVPPLSVPDLDHHHDLVAFAQYGAVGLFLDRAQAARPNFALTEENAPTVAAICHRLDGLPLALELAAARIRLFPPHALLDRLSHRLSLLTGGPLDRPIRQQTLRNTVDWSYSLLSPAEQALFARLSVFAGGFTLDAAEGICNAGWNLETHVLDGVASLVEKSLLRQQGDGEPRFGMLETIREYAVEKLESRGEAEAIHRHHALYFLGFAEGIVPQLDGPGQVQSRKRLEDEHNNLRAALDWAGAHEEAEVGLRLAIAMDGLWLHARVYEALGWFERLLALDRSAGNFVTPSLLVPALQLAAGNAWSLGKSERARELTEQSLALVDQLGDRREIAYRLQGAGWLLRALAEYPRATSVLEQALSMFKALDDRAGMGLTLLNLGDVAREQGEAERIIERCEESLRLFRELDNKPYVAFSLQDLGVAARMQDDLNRARVLYEGALKMCSELEMVRGKGEILAGLASVARDQSDLDEAEKLLREALQLESTGATTIEETAMAFEAMAGLAAARGRNEHAAVLFGAAHRQRTRIGKPLWPVDRPAYEGDVAAAREALGAARFAEAWGEGLAMTVEQAIAYALNSAHVR